MEKRPEKEICCGEEWYWRVMKSDLGPGCMTPTPPAAQQFGLSNLYFRALHVFLSIFRKRPTMARVPERRAAVAESHACRAQRRALLVRDQGVLGAGFLGYKLPTSATQNVKNTLKCYRKL